MTSGTLMVFARAPVEGAVKRRLAAALGPARALALYQAFLDDACALAGAVASSGARAVLAVAGAVDHPAIARLAREHGLAVVEQRGDDLGARMAHAIASQLAYGPVCVIGSDSPTLERALVEDAFARLERHDVVLGPATDGGYWLVGARRPAPELFAGVEWGSDRVLTETLARLRACDHALLPFWYDVDDAAGLELLRAHLGVLPPSVAPATRRTLAALGLL
jgi:rSAM/selenodomain-associated transferase 1